MRLITGLYGELSDCALAQIKMKKCQVILLRGDFVRRCWSGLGKFGGCGVESSVR